MENTELQSNENTELQLNKDKLTAGVSFNSPEKEIKLKEVLVKYGEAVRTIANLEDDNKQLKNETALLKKVIYGQKSEKTEVIFENGEQLCMFNEAEKESTEDLTREVKVAEHTRKTGKTHKESFENLPCEEVIHKAEERNCPECGSEMETVGKEFVRDEVVYVPSKLFVRKHYVEVLKCPVCGSNEDEDKNNPDITAGIQKKPWHLFRLFPTAFVRLRFLLTLFTKSMRRQFRFTGRKKILNPWD